MGPEVIALIVLAVFVFFVAASGVRIVPQARAGVVERLGRYNRTLEPGLTIVLPFIDRVKPLIDLREQVVSFPPNGVITEDNVTVNIDTVLYFTITDPKSASYEVANPLQAIEQLTVTTLRNVIGGLTLSTLLTLLIVPGAFSLAVGLERWVGPRLSRRLLTYRPGDADGQILRADREHQLGHFGPGAEALHQGGEPDRVGERLHRDAAPGKVGVK